MSSRTSLKLMLGFLLLTGCQSGKAPGSWFASNEPVYSADELTAMEGPQPASARPQLSPSMANVDATLAPAPTAIANGPSVIRPVSAQSSAPPVAAGRVDELVRSGQAAIREAGQGDPARLQQARALFGEALRLDTENASANHGMAVVADLQQDWAVAEHHYKMALRARPQDPSLLNDIGYSYLLQNRFHEATSYLNQTLQLSPQHERAHINLALLSLKRGDRADAENRLNSIYSAADAQTTLARLESDLNPAAQNPGSNTNSMHANANAAGYPSNASMQSASFQPANAGNPSGATAAQQPGNSPFAQQASTSQSQRPVHVYPPGVEVEPTVDESNTITAGLPAYHGSADPGQYQPGPNYGPMGAQSPHPHSQGSGYGAQQSANGFSAGGPPVTSGYQNPGQPPQPTQSTVPLAGLNAGPGMLFPLGARTPVNGGMNPAAAQPMSGGQFPSHRPNSPAAYPTQAASYIPPTAAGRGAAPAYGQPPSNHQQPNYGQPQGNVQPQGYGQPPNYGQQFSNGQQPAYGQQPQIASQQSQQQMHQNAYSADPRSQMPQPNQGPGQQGMQQGMQQPSPMAEYEQQLQTLDNQYNQTLQQMDGSGRRM